MATTLALTTYRLTRNGRKMTFEYAPAPESRAIVSIKPKSGHFINGSFVAGKKHFPTVHPATEELLSLVSLGGVPEVDKAV